MYGPRHDVHVETGQRPQAAGVVLHVQIILHDDKRTPRQYSRKLYDTIMQLRYCHYIYCLDIIIHISQHILPVLNLVQFGGGVLEGLALREEDAARDSYVFSYHA